MELLQNFAFPAAMCIALFWKVNQQDKEHKEEMKQLSEALNNNTLAITKLIDHIENR